MNWEIRPFLLIFDSKLKIHIQFVIFMITCGNGTVRLQQSLSAS